MIDPARTDQTTTDVLIVGGGIMGAAVARLLRESDPDVRIVMVDAGAPIGAAPGVHLHDIDDPAVVAQYGARVSTGIQGMYTGARAVSEIPDDVRELAPGMVHALAFGEDAKAMPASAIGWNAGGMGVHWTAATPWPAGEETFDYGDAEQWAADLETARRLLAVHPAPIGPTEPGRIVLDVLRARFDSVSAPGRGPQTMPMAVQPSETGRQLRTAPGTIFPPISVGGDPAFELRTGELATSIIVDGNRVAGVRLRRIADDERSEVRARIVVACADTLRTPQLLFASGIRPEALGRYLNEHAFITGRVLMDPERFGIDLDSLPLPQDGEFSTDSLWLPQNGEAQPFHGQISNTTFVDEHGARLAYSVGLSLYAPVQSRPTNRVVFSDTEHDIAGMPRMTLEFEYSAAELELIDRALDTLQTIAEDFGDFDPATERAVLTPGSSLHLTGTVRMGESDDGTSVCDPDGRVWGLDNLYLAGTGVVPTAVVANATLTGTVTAVRAARAVLRALDTATL